MRTYYLISLTKHLWVESSRQGVLSLNHTPSIEYFLMRARYVSFLLTTAHCAIARANFFLSLSPFSTAVSSPHWSLSPLLPHFIYNWIDFLTWGTVQKVINAWSLLHGALKGIVRSWLRRIVAELEFEGSLSWYILL